MSPTFILAALCIRKKEHEKPEIRSRGHQKVRVEIIFAQPL